MKDCEITEFVADHAPKASRNAVAYSVLFGRYDKPPEAVHTAGIDYFLFTDRPDTVIAPWKAVHVDSKKYGPQRTGRYFKCLGHRLFPMADRSVYFDASFMFVRPLERLLHDHARVKFGLFKHLNHSDISAEAEACIKQDKDDPDVLMHQVFRYRGDGLPEPSDCYATGVLIRDLSDPAVGKVNEMWCQEIAKGSVRDQISLPYVFWKQCFRPSVIQGDVFYNNYLVPRPHANASLLKRIERSIALRLYLMGILRRGSDRSMTK